MLAGRGHPHCTPFTHILQPTPGHLRTPNSAGPPTSPKPKLKAPLPAKGDVPLMGLASDRDFVTTNALEAILSQVGACWNAQCWQRDGGAPHGCACA